MQQIPPVSVMPPSVHITEQSAQADFEDDAVEFWDYEEHHGTWHSGESGGIDFANGFEFAEYASYSGDLSDEDFVAMDEIELAMREAWIEQVEHEQGDIEDDGFFANPEAELRTQHIG